MQECLLNFREPWGPIDKRAWDELAFYFDFVISDAYILSHDAVKRCAWRIPSVAIFERLKNWGVAKW